MFILLGLTTMCFICIKAKASDAVGLADVVLHGCPNKDAFGTPFWYQIIGLKTWICDLMVA